MSFPQWPTPAEVALRLSGWGVTAPPGFDGAAAVREAVGFFEGLTGDSPWRAESVPVTVNMVGAGFELVDLPGAFVTLESILVAGAPVAGQGLPVAGPYRSVRLPVRVPEFAEVSVTGRRGVSEVIPDDLWFAVRDRAAVSALMTQGSNGPITRVQQDTVSIQYAEAGGLNVDLILRRTESVMQRYRRPVLGGGGG